MRLDFPTLERPANATSTLRMGGSVAADPAAAMNCQSPAKSLRPASISAEVKEAGAIVDAAFKAAQSQPGAFFFTNSDLMLSNSSILAPFLRMMTLCWITESVLFQAQ